MAERTMGSPGGAARRAAAPRIVIAGAGYAGVSCALRLARQTGRHVEITLVSATERFVERIRLHQLATGQAVGQWPLRALLGRARVRLHVGRIERIDWAARALIVDGEPLGWDELVLALGSAVDLDAVPGARAHARVLESETVAPLHAELAALAGRGGRLVVAGGGLTGIEAAAEIAAAFPALSVTLLSQGRLAEGWSAAAREHLLRALGRLGIERREGVRVRAVGADRVATDHGEIACDLCLWAGGFVAHPLARRSGMAVNARGQVLVDAGLRSISHPAVRVAGDLAAPVEASGLALPMGCKSAMPTGAYLADALAGRLRGAAERPFAFAVPFFCVSLGRKDGLIQWLAADGSLTGRVLTGLAGAWFKELVCRGTMWALHLERRGLAGIQWLRARGQPAAEPLSQGAQRS